jgi:hypothetical protein
MTEADWLACTDPKLMLAHVGDKAGDRKNRLLACAYCRSIWPRLTVKRCRRAVETGERFADDPRLETERARAEQLARQALLEAPRERGGSKRLLGREEAFRKMALTTTLPPDEINPINVNAIERWVGPNNIFYYSSFFGAVAPSLVRDVFGNPFRPVSFLPAWRTDTAVSLARAMYESRDFGAMPILADALQDAGCDSADTLDHCRGPGPHVRGCWVVDLVLAKG